MTIRLCVSPEAPVVAAAAVPAERRLTGEGIRLGILDNSKGNADHLLRFVVEAARAALPIKSVITRRKPASSRPAETAVLDDLAREADVVLSAMAD